MALLRQSASGESTVLEADHLVGRSQRAALRLDSPFVSAQHATIRWVGGAWEVRDLGSRNGTIVNDTPLKPGQAIALAPGSRIAFGHADQSWELVDDSPPRPMVVPLDGDFAPLFLDGDMLALPTHDHPAATVLRGSDGAWRLEHDDEAVTLTNHQVFDVAGKGFRFSCPEALLQTSTVDWHDAAGFDLAQLRLRFRVSREEEFVELHVEGGREPVTLGSRGHNYILLMLARARLDDIGAKQPESSCGWMYQDFLIEALRASSERLNIDIFRIRRQFATIGWISDAANIVERRPRNKQIRIGVASLTIENI
jgi:hypothetical protein